mgnify:CR=1 FL=1
MSKSPRKPEQHPERHEHLDVRARPLLIAVGIGLAFAIVAHVFIWYLMGWYGRATEACYVQPSAVPQAVEVPEPRLQGIPGFNPNTPAQDWEAFSRQQLAELRAYRPTDFPDRAKIPIDRAMQLILNPDGTLKEIRLPSTQPTTRTIGPQPKDRS